MAVKLIVEVVGATNLMPKDAHSGSASPYVELIFDDQIHRTTVKERDVNPAWNEKFTFTIRDPSALPSLTLDANVYSQSTSAAGSISKPFLGRVRLNSTAFVSSHDAIPFSYPLEKRGMFSRVRGELSLKVFLHDDLLQNQAHLHQSNPMNSIFPNSQPQNPRAQSPDRPEAQMFYNLPPAPKVHSGVLDSSRVKVINQDHDQNISMSTRPQVVQAVYNNNPTYPPQMNLIPPNAGMFPNSGADFALKETSPNLGGGKVVGGWVIRGMDRPTSTYDLVEQMKYLFIRIVKARDLPAKDITGSLDPYVEVTLGNYKGKTRHHDKNQHPEWNDVFAFPKDRLQGSKIEIVVMDKNTMITDGYVGKIVLDLNEVPTRVPPDSPLAPEWYRLEDGHRMKLQRGELMMAIWEGTQADEAFSEAWHSDSPSTTKEEVHAMHTRSKVYHSPRLWYLRVHVIQAQDIALKDKGRYPDVCVQVQVGSHSQRTFHIHTRDLMPIWNQNLMLVAAEPFEEHLVLTLLDRIGPGKDEEIGRCIIPLTGIEKRADDKPSHSRWFDLERPSIIDAEMLKRDKFSTKLNVGLRFEGAYHVLDETIGNCSDLRPSARQLWKSPIGVLELGILDADGLHPMKTRDGRGSSDTYCVAKYGSKWVRTRTVIDNPNPRWNEQYTWEVYDPCTVLTVGVFDNCHVSGGEKSNGLRDLKIGKVRIRLSTLETGRVYTHSYPLLVLHNSGVKKMGEIHIAIRFSCTSIVNMMTIYSKPMLPKMHYSKPLDRHQQDSLRVQSVNIMVTRLGRAEPPLRREVVEYMSDFDAHKWSMRRSKANIFRLMYVFSGFFALGRWFSGVCAWDSVINTVMVHLLFLILSFFPELILPTAFLYLSLIGLWNWRFRPRHPPHMDMKLSHAENTPPDELDEEFDTFPSSRAPPDILRMRYDRLREVAGRIQGVVGDIATQAERFHSLLSWRDPRATSMFLVFSFFSALFLYVTPFQVVLIAMGVYTMRHPRFRGKTPSAPINYFRRLPAMTDCIL